MARRRKHHRRRARSNSGHRRLRHSYALAPRRRRNPTRYIARRSRRRNASLSFGGFHSGDLLWLGGGALVNGIIARSLPQMIAPQYNVSWVGYGLNLVAGSIGAWGIGKLNRRAGQGAWIGMIVAVGQRIIAEKFGAGSAGASAGMSGDLDFDLGYYMSDPFPYQQGDSGGPYPGFPGTPYNASLPTANAAANARQGQTRALVGGPGVPAGTGAGTGSVATPGSLPQAWQGGAWG
jgi:hypothetical protein